MTEALDQLKIVSLQELVIWNAWVRWEEGLRLAYRQWEIGEAAARMQTTCAQLILILKLNEGKSKQYKAWRRQYLGCPDDFKRE